MGNCVHNVNVKVEGGNIVSYCTKCGAILNVQPQVMTEISCNNTGSGIILHD